MATSMRAGAQNLVHLEVVSFPDPTTPSADRFQYCLHRCGLGTRLLLRVFTYSPAEWMAALRCVRIREQLKTVKKKKSQVRVMTRLLKFGSAETHQIGHSRFFCIFLRVSRTSSTFSGSPILHRTTTNRSRSTRCVRVGSAALPPAKFSADFGP